MKPIVKVENLSKRYKIGNSPVPYATLQDAFLKIVRIPLGMLSRQNQKEHKSFWALREVTFEIEPGTVIGIIGRNGAGKSTLLKILSRITEPTTGWIELYGRVNSLLEVGTGFHPELTGRENIFVNGAILGMKHSEIKRRFDEIVDFSGVETFLDTPVKHYSSGMYTRLAFSVAAHLDSDILILDEILSVGDAQFQKKCLGKVSDVAKSGRTIFFVSHNMAAVENLCQSGMVLEKGRVTFIGNQNEAISHYLKSSSEHMGTDLIERRDREGSGEVYIRAIEFKDSSDANIHTAISGRDISICFHYETTAGYRQNNIVIGFMIRTHLETPVFLQHNRLTGNNWSDLPPKGTFICRIRRLPLPPASYRLGYSVMFGDEYLDRIDDASDLIVAGGDFYGSGEVPPITHGVCLVDAEWQLTDDTISNENRS